ncbi:MAG TPA: serine/threonine-protein kinase [Polyangia bacterium]|nr:serine/threonine-protein kinase [Polyangia bacterium]
MFEAGDTMGPYTIVRRLGAGAMGDVYQARHRHMERDAAIKVLRAELTEDAAVVNRFFTEARATAAVRHSGIVEIFDCDLHRSGRAFIVMEYLAGEDLGQRLARTGSLADDWPALRALGRQLASALSAAHAVGIVHRDLKPANIFLVGGDGREPPLAKIVDFGIAKLLQRDGAGHSQTQTGHILGTPLYMSPEQARGAKTIDHRTDIYSLGCVLFEMITGQPPFVRKGPAEVIVAHLHEPAPRASSLEPSVPAALDELVAQMLAKNVQERPGAMTDVLARLAEPPAAMPGHVATRLLPGGKASADSGPVVAPVVSAAPPANRPAPAVADGARPGGPPPRAVLAGRDAQIFARAGDTTLGNSAAEMVAATGVVGSAGRRLPWLPIGAAALVVAVGIGFAVTRAGGDAPAAARAPSAAPAPLATSPVAPPAPAPAAVGPIAITSQPSGAEVWIGAETAARGRTPLTLELPPGASTHAVLRAAGREPVGLTLDPRDRGARHVVLPAAAAAAPSRGHRHHAKRDADFKAIED